MGCKGAPSTEPHSLKVVQLESQMVELAGTLLGSGGEKGATPGSFHPHWPLNILSHAHISQPAQRLDCCPASDEEFQAASETGPTKHHV